MKTLSHYFLAVVAMIVVPHCVQAETLNASQKPNILFIMADDLGPEWLSCYGSEAMKTPHIDALAKGGMRFLNAYSMPKCTPTRATLLTGRYPFRHGWIGHWDVPRWGAGCHFDPKHNVSFARVMKSAGYATAAAGKWQINDFRLQPDIMQQHGFDEHCMWTGYESGNPPSAERYWDAYVNTNGKSKTHTGKFGTDIFVDFLIDFMKRNKHKPMMLYFPMALPHGPLVATPKRPDAKDKYERYRAMVEYVDLALGRLVKAIDDLGIRERTIVIFTTDNGSSRGFSAKMNGRLVRGGKDRYWESGMHVPFIVNCPGLVPEGVVTDALTDFTDMLPTFAELGGAQLPKGVTLDGRSITPLILGKAKDSPRKWILAMGAGTMIRTKAGVHSRTKVSDRVIRNKRFKLWWADGKSSALYDLKNDPGEKNNLIDSANPKFAAARKELEAALKTLPADAWPKYDPLPPQSWDKPFETAGKRKSKKKRKKKQTRERSTS
ncbi:MAG: sulfatase-like hydrolase/transferase [Planctomycetes bacterium]|nr:sulfatase-like hydrolase/transferase [Planctomycetota bacterium]